MLNEFVEYQEYTTVPFSGRLYKKFLIGGTNPNKKPLTGVNRAMVIVARHFLFSEDGKRDFERAENALRAWLGKEYTSSDEEIKEIENWLPKYLESLKTEDTGEKIDTMIKEISKNRFEDKDSFSYAEKAGTDDFNKRTISEILAEASNAGPLKEWVLIEKEDVFTSSNPIVFLKTENSFKKFNPKKKNSVKEMDWIRKLIGCCLLEKKRAGGLNNEYVCLCQADYQNWANMTSNPDLDYLVGKGGYSIPDECLIQNSGLSKVWKIKLNQRVLDCYEVVTKEEAEQLLKEDDSYPYTIYEDDGSKNKLKIMY